MASAIVLPAMSTGGNQSLHPFFTRPNQSAKQDTNAVEVNNARDDVDDDYQEERKEAKPKRGGNKRGPKKSQPQDGKQKTQKTLGEIVNPKASDVIDVTDKADLNATRKKRRRTNEHESVEVGVQQPASAVNGYVQEPVEDEGRASPRVLIPVSSPLPQAPPPASGQDEASTATVPKTPPKKLLRLNAAGKFSSPPSKKPDEDKASTGHRRSGRSRKTNLANTDKQLIVKLSYGGDATKRSELGQKIERILCGQETVSKVKTSASPRKRTRQNPRPDKPAHPFFSRDAPKKHQAAPKKESPRKASAVTPGKLRVQSLSERIPEPKDSSQAIGSALLRDRLMTRHPGAREAPFPSKDVSHVRGLDTYEEPPIISDAAFDQVYGYRKRKQAKLPVPSEESILTRFAPQLTIAEEGQIRPDGFQEPSPNLTLPDRLLISGHEISQRVLKQLSVPLLSEDDDEISVSQRYTHPSLQRLFDRIPNTLTAFDETKGESQSWTLKYAPTASADVLQPEKEMAVLRDWLQSLAVQSVEGAASVPAKAAPSKAAEKPKKANKRKSKADDMDDFLVDSDEDVTEMSEIFDDSRPCSAAGTHKFQNSIVQVVHDGTKLSNAVLLSGPNGCGKTAAAYAVAKELGYKVFEISSSERRSGKDVLDKVGDMTENHLVRHHGTEDGADLSSAEEPGQMDEAFQKDLESGRQGKMSAFFKPKTQPKQVEPKKAVKERKLKAVQEAIRKQPKDQKQSLILLEEIDVLFKDDKDFWSTVLKLITTSKRPFIMTCNDEDLVPLQAMSLHAILRFSQPSPELATDYMLLLAAAEGHLLRRPPVAALYQKHRLDLRASISELDYWCQMGVGDPRGGLSWIYQRYPPGSDLDAHGRQLRVVSEGTYESGVALPKTCENPEEAMVWAWNELGADPADLLNVDDLLQDVQSSNSSANAQQRHKALKSLSRLKDALSAADACSASGLPGAAPLDPTQPEMPDKARGHYIEGMALMQTDERIDYTDLSKHIFTAVNVSAHRSYYDLKIQSNDIVWKALSRRGDFEDEQQLSRRAFACFDAVAVPKELSAASSSLLQSVFDGPLETITLDLAPYVRCIVHSDQAREEMRDRLNLLTSDGRQAKRARTTRAARSALEGGQRASTRREKWLPNDLNVDAVLATGGKTWPLCLNALDIASTEGSAKEETGVALPATSSAEDEIQYE